ncbi:hypothetical protein LZP73_17155 [Shewanella sp. AS16]|uniref:hypothetical protein n=1 Tax=Shewanella sp. AS16 TaxID=2907625 RepID=UPI001F394726|nr:hypothetical protein [Shewanella sp. AS16]MCE9687909.1 hypothetical protein [Shewanella sp. AS16]
MKFLAFISLMLCAFSTWATKWPVEETVTKISENGNLIARLTSGSYPDSKIQAHNASIAIYKWEIENGYVFSHTIYLPYRFSPLNFVIANSGYVLTIDKPVAEETGPAAAIFDDSGVMIKDFTIEQLLPSKKDNKHLIFNDVRRFYRWSCGVPTDFGDEIAAPHLKGAIIFHMKEARIENLRIEDSTCE